ncbi:MAG TPA: hypothetical protein GX734_06725 [Clostridiaceae bacterium]|nr:hypothetical protein [Clostridiaceae bacterium]
MDYDILLDTYIKIEERLEKLDLASLWPGFSKPPYALYTDESMCFDGELMPKPEYFYGNTAIHYDGSMIAIWMLKSEQIDTEEAIDRLTARIVHEMFHVYQVENGESRFPRDLELIAFPLNAELVALANRENDLLGKYTDMMVSDEHITGTLSQKQQCRLDAISILRRISELRSTMRSLSDGATINEWRVETLEGRAEYVGFKALRQLNSDLAIKEIDIYMKNLREATDAMDHRGRGYHSGLLLSSLAEMAELNLDTDFASEKTLWELIEEQLSATGESSEYKVILTDGELKEAHVMIDQEQRRRAEVLASFQAKFPIEKPIKASICGYDPMNLQRVGDFLISTSFLMINQDGEQHRLMGEHLIRMKPGDCWEVVALYEAGA